jgi:transposase-like protein
VKRHPRSYWEKLVAEINAGASVASVAQRHRVRDTTLRWWCSQLRTDKPSSAVRLVSVEMSSISVPIRHVEIRCGNAVLRVEEGTDVGYVAALARALSSAC